MNKLPKFLKKYFWDVDFKSYNLQKYPNEVILRILEMGNEQAVNWMRKVFPKRQVIQVLQKRRGFSPKSAVFWSEVLRVPKKEVLCLQTPYQSIKGALWPY